MSGDDDVVEGPGAVAVDDPPTDPSVVGGSGDPESDDAGGDRVDDGKGGDPGAPDVGPVDDPPALPLATELARVTGMLLVVLLPIHLVTVLLADPTEVGRLLDRWENRWWLLADWGFLTVGLSHALFSLRAPVQRLGSSAGVIAECPHCGGALPAADDGFGILAYRLLVGLTVVLYLAASWAMLRLV